MRLAVILLLALTAVPVRAHLFCTGDCDFDGSVEPHEIDELITDLFVGGVGLACPATGIFGSNRAAELVASVRGILGDTSFCPAATPTAATPAASPTPTATAGVTTPTSEWIPLAPLAAGARQEVGVAELDRIIYVIGGFAPGVTDRVEAYDIDADRWQTVAPLPHAAHHIGAGTAAGAVYAIGGLAGLQFIPLREVFRYDAGADRWDRVADLPTERGALAVATVNDQLYAVGGSGAGVSVSDHAVYDPVSDRWTVLAPLPSRRNHLAAAAIDGQVYVVGGRDAGNSAELHRYDPGTGQWQALASMPTARSGLAAAVVDGLLVVMGGEVNNANPPTRVFTEVEVYDPASDSWFALEPMAVPRHGIGAVAVDGLIYVPGGAVVAGFGATARNDALRIIR